jgi:hypothetical protein
MVIDLLLIYLGSAEVEFYLDLVLQFVTPQPLQPQPQETSCSGSPA